LTLDTQVNGLKNKDSYHWKTCSLDP